VVSEDTATVLPLYNCNVVDVPNLDRAHANQICMYCFGGKQHMHDKKNMHDQLQLQRPQTCMF
jgi:hypothetical protein